jgi:hypothetical protein
MKQSNFQLVNYLVNYLMRQFLSHLTGQLEITNKIIYLVT